MYSNTFEAWDLNTSAVGTEMGMIIGMITDFFFFSLDIHFQKLCI